jgi:pantoate--beta-alanine ligase
MIVEPTIAGVRRWRVATGGSVGLVPTMGYLHAGHVSLVERARAETERVAVSIFVNPAQFGPREDLSSYPRDLDSDLRLLEAAGVELVFTPAAGTIYPPGFDSWVEPGAIAELLEGKSRPGHFRGVCTVVLKLFNIVAPQRAYFGRKDAQQLRVIRKMVRDLDLPIEIVPMPIVRELDGLAMSSRNAYLDAEERSAALVLSRALRHAADLFARGVDDADALRTAVQYEIAVEPRVALEYVSVADGETLEEQAQAGPGTLVSLAARVGRTRLIDNLELEG